MIRSNHRRSNAALSFAVDKDHTFCAFDAASIIRRVSEVPHLATFEIVSPVAGLITSSVSPESASIQTPSI